MHAPAVPVQASFSSKSMNQGEGRGGARGTTDNIHAGRNDKSEGARRGRANPWRVEGDSEQTFFCRKREGVVNCCKQAKNLNRQVEI